MFGGGAATSTEKKPPEKKTEEKRSFIAANRVILIICAVLLVILLCVSAGNILSWMNSMSDNTNFKAAVGRVEKNADAIAKLSERETALREPGDRQKRDISEETAEDALWDELFGTGAIITGFTYLSGADGEAGVYYNINCGGPSGTYVIRYEKGAAERYASGNRSATVGESIYIEN